MVSSSPRLMGRRCGTKVTSGVSPTLRSIISISGVCRWRGEPSKIPYGEALSLTVTKWVLTLAFAPAPLTPESALTVTDRIPVPNRRTTGASARIAAVG
jgi:hypothetical protein